MPLGEWSSGYEFEEFEVFEDPDGRGGDVGAGTRAGLGPSRGVVIAMAAGLVAVIALVGWLGRGSPSQDRAAPPDPRAQQSAGDRPGTGSESETGPSVADIPPSEEHLAAEALAESGSVATGGQGDQADQVVVEHGYDEIADLVIVYPGTDGPVVLKQGRLSQPPVEIASGFEQARLPLLVGEDVTWAIDPTDLDTSYLVSTRYEVIAIDGDGTVGYVNDQRRPVNVGISSFGSWGPGVDIMADTEIFAVSGRGILLSPRTGGTYVVTGLGPEQVSDHAMVAASTGASLYRYCGEGLSCGHLLELGTDESVAVELDLDGRERLSLAPDGEWLLISVPEGPSRLVNLINGDQSPDFTDWHGVRAVGWSDSGDAVAVIAGASINVVLPDRHMAIPIQVPVPPTTGSLLIFE